MVIEKEKNRSWEHFLASPLWMNDLFTVGGKPIFYKDWQDGGICFVNDLVNENGSFLKYEELQNFFHLNLDVMNYNSIISLLSNRCKQCAKGNCKIASPFIPSSVVTILKSRKGSRDMYSIFNRNESISTGNVKWNTILNLDMDHWKSINKLPFVVTKNTKILWLQYRVNQRILTTNKFANKINITSTPFCTFCKNEIETIEHLLWECECVQDFISEIDQWLLQNGISIAFTKNNFLLGNIKHCCRGDPENNIILWMKQYIYNKKCFNKHLNVLEMKEKLKYMYNIEKMIAVKNKCLENFDKLWNCYRFLNTTHNSTNIV